MVVKGYNDKPLVHEFDEDFDDGFLSKLKQGDIRIRAELEKEALQLEETECSVTYGGLTTQKPKDGIVIR